MPLGVYVASLESAPAFWDTGEAQVVPWIFGIMHPTGFPVFTILAGIFAHVFAFGTVAWRIALFSALAMSGAAWLVSRIVIELRNEPWIAAASAWLFAFGPIVWVRGTRPEVHALAIFFAVLTMYAAIRWYRRGETSWLVGGAFAWGLGMATHPIDAFLFPALALIVFFRFDATAARALALASAAVFLGLAFYAYLPARSAIVTAQHLDPTSRLGLPPGQSFWDNDHPSSFSGFREVISGADYSSSGTFPRLLLPDTYANGGMTYARAVLNEFTPFGLLLAVIGLVLLWRRDWKVGLAAFLALAVPTDFSFAYTIEADIDRYYLISLAMIAVFAGYACASIAARGRLARITGVAALTIIAAWLLFSNRTTFNQPSDSGARALITTVIQKTPDNAVLLAPWLDATPIAYAAYVEHRLGHRILHSSWYADDAAYIPEWMKERPVYIVDQVFGSVKGYHLVTIPGSPTLYEVVKN